MTPSHDAPRRALLKAVYALSAGNTLKPVEVASAVRQAGLEPSAATEMTEHLIHQRLLKFRGPRRLAITHAGVRLVESN
jgi:hypothetical protein